MRTWATLLGGLTVWAAHFFAIYAIACILPGQTAARWLVVGATLPAIVADAVILWRTRAGRARPDPLALIG